MIPKPGSDKSCIFYDRVKGVPMFYDTLKHRYRDTSLVESNAFIQHWLYFPGIVLVLVEAFLQVLENSVNPDSAIGCTGVRFYSYCKLCSREFENVVVAHVSTTLACVHTDR